MKFLYKLQTVTTCQPVRFTGIEHLLHRVTTQGLCMPAGPGAPSAREPQVCLSGTSWGYSEHCGHRQPFPLLIPQQDNPYWPVQRGGNAALPLGMGAHTCTHMCTRLYPLLLLTGLLPCLINYSVFSPALEFKIP